MSSELVNIFVSIDDVSAHEVMNTHQEYRKYNCQLYPFAPFDF
jgi:hypothetical protein